MRERDGMALGLAYLFGAGATLVVLTLILPHGHGASVPGLLGISAAAYVVTAFLALEGRRLPAPAFQLILAFGAILVGGCAWWGGESARVYPLFYVWVALYGLYFFSTRFGFGIMVLAATMPGR